MNIIERKIEALKEFEDNIYDTIRLTVVDNEHIIADMNSQVQLYEQGIDRNGDKIAEYAPYRPLTIQIKLMKGQPTSRVTLRDTGDFHASFKVIANNISFFIDASDIKTDMLIKKYGEQILGLTEDNLNELIWEYIYPDLLTKLKDLV